MVLYTCNRCLKEFKKKDDFIKHTERRKTLCEIKTPIKPIKPIETPIILDISQNKNGEFAFLQQNVKICDIEIKCEHCLKIFTRSDSLKKHLNGRCKIIKIKRKHLANKFL